MTSNVVKFNSFRKSTPLGDPQALIEEDLLVYIPHDCEILETTVPWSKSPIEALHFEYEIDGTFVPYYFIGTKYEFTDARNKMIVCNVQLIKEVFIDGSWMVSAQLKPRPRLPPVGRSILMVLSRTINEMSGFDIIYMEPLPVQMNAKFAFVKEKRSK